MKTKITFLTTLLLTFSFTFGFAQTQIGLDIDGELANDNSGFSVSLSADGSIVAIGANRNDGNGNDSGHVRVYQNNGGSWTQVGSDIDGEAIDDQSGFSVSLSADGSTLAIGARYNDGVSGSNSGHVRIYQNSGGSWTQVGSDIDGEAINDGSGGSVSLSADGSMVAIGANFASAIGYSYGHVRIYRNSGGTWTQVGSDIDGEAYNDQLGLGVCLSADGSTVAIGARNHDGINGLNSGHVQVYKHIGGTWTQVGSDIDGEAAGDNFGGSVSLSADGSTVAIGSNSNDDNGFYSGHVRIYHNLGGTWTQIGIDIDGEAAGDQSGISVSLSPDGNTVAIGARNNEGINGPNSGHVRVYQNIGGTWTQVGSDIDGEAAGDNFGYSVSLSEDGSVVAIGAISNDGNGFNSGHVRVYELAICTPPEITNPGSQIACGGFELPVIAGTNLSGNEAYYDDSQANGGTLIKAPITSTQTVWIFDNAIGDPACSDEESFLVTINSITTPTFSFNTTYCEGSTADNLPTTSDNGISGTWTASAIDTSISGDTDYVFTPDDPSQCGEPVSVSVTVNPSVQADDPADVTTCDGFTLPALSAGNAYWTGPGGTGTEIAAGTQFGPNPSTGSYTVILYVYAGTEVPCAPDENQFQITVLGNPDFTASSLEACEDGSGALGEATFNLNDAIPDLIDGNAFNFNAAVTFYDSEDDANNENNEIGSTYTGGSTTIWVRADAANDNDFGCYFVTSYTITVNPLPTVTANTTAIEICEGEEVTLTGGGADFYEWDNAVTDGEAFVPTETTTYTVTGTVETGCENTAQVTVTVTPKPPAIPTDVTICSDETYTWTANLGPESSDQSNIVTQAGNINVAPVFTWAQTFITASNGYLTTFRFTDLMDVSAAGDVLVEIGEGSDPNTGNIVASQLIPFSTTGSLDVSFENPAEVIAGQGYYVQFNAVSGQASVEFDPNNNYPSGNLWIKSSGPFREYTSNDLSFTIFVSPVVDDTVNVTYDGSNGSTTAIIEGEDCTADQVLNLTVLPEPAAPTTTDLSYCVDDAPDAITTAVTATGTLAWFSDEAATTPIVEPTIDTSVASTNTYYVTQTGTNTCVSTTAAVVVKVNPLPTAADASLAECDTDEVDFEPFTLTAADETVLNDQAAADHMVTYHASQADADDDANPLVSPYTNTTANSQTIYARVEVNATGCYATSEVTLTVNPLPTVTFTAPEDQEVNSGVLIALDGGFPTGGVYSGTGVTDGSNGETYSFDTATLASGPVTITYTYTDANGCTNSASDDIGVAIPIDSTPPTITCPAAIVTSNETGLCAASFPITPATAEDDVSAPDDITITGIRSDGLELTDSFPVGETTITWTAEDESGKVSDSCDQLITVTDDEAPTVIGQNITVELDENGLVTLDPKDLDNSTTPSTDNCTLPENLVYNASQTAFDCSDLGTPVTVFFTVTDEANNESASVTAEVTVIDVTVPVLTCGGPIVQTSLSGLPLVIEITPPTVSDNCDALPTLSGLANFPDTSTLILDNQTGQYSFPVGTTTIVWTAMDAEGNPGTCQQTVTVNFTASSASSITSFNAAGVSGTITATNITAVVPFGTDLTNLAPDITIPEFATVDPASGVGVDFSTGQAVTYTVTAQDGSTQTMYSVTITEGASPVPIIVSVFPENGATDVPLDTPISITFDRPILRADGPSFLSTDTNFFSFVLDPDLGTAVISGNTVTFSAGDNALDLDPNSTTFIDIPGNAFEDGAGNPFGGFSWSFSMVTTADANPPLGTLTPISGTTDVLPNQLFQITFDEEVVNKSGIIAVTDAVGNQLAVFDENNFDLQFNGTNSILTFQLTSDIIQLQSSTGYRIYVPPFSFEDVAGNDYVGTGITPGGGIEAGINWQFITAAPDGEAPDITCPANIAQSAGSQCSMAITLIDPTATDNVSTTFTFEGVRSDGAALTDPFFFGDTQISWTATDEAGNTSASCIQTVTITSSGNCWEKVGGDLISSGDADNLSFSKDANGLLYVAYRDYELGGISVDRFQNGSWETVGNPLYIDNGFLNPLIAISQDNVPHVSYYDNQLGRHIIKRFVNGAWEEFAGIIEGAAFEFGKGRIAFNPANELHVLYLTSGNKHTLKKWDGNAWITIGQTAFSNSGLDYRLAFDSSGTPYVSYQEADISPQRLTVQRFNGADWEFVGPAAFTQGIGGFHALGISPDGTPYVAYYDSGGTNVVVVKKFDGNDWIDVGDSPFSGSAQDISLDFDAFGVPYIGFKAPGSFRAVKRLEDTIWVSIGGSGPIVAGNADDFFENMLICIDNTDVNNPKLYAAIAKDGILMRKILPGVLDTEAHADLIDATYLQGSSNPQPTGPILRAEQGNREVYLKFDLSAFSGPITQATLQMQVASDPGNGTLEVFLGSSSNWTETGLNGGNKPTAVGSALASITGTHSLGQVKTWDLNVARLSGGGELTLIVKHSNGNDVAFASDETNQAPQLTITAGANGPIDADGDGFDSDVDCDDSNPSIHPDALEICDGIDNNCDGLIDDQDTSVTCNAVEAPANLVDATFLQGTSNPSPTGPILRAEQGNRVVYIKFDLGTLGGPITQAQLKMQVASDPGSGTLQVFLGSSSDWTESGLNGSNKPTDVGSALATITGTHSIGQVKTWDLDVGRLPNGGLVTLIVKHSNGNDVAFASDETNQAPQLIITSAGANGPIDADGDGFDSDVDCDDSNSSIYPGALEICDGIDNNCDGLIDDQDPLVTCNSVEGPADLIDATFLQGNSNPSPTGPILRTEQGNRVVYIKFDLGTLGGPITQAQLKMQVASDPGSGTLQVFLGSSSGWTEAGLNGGNKPVEVGTALATITGTHSIGQIKVWDLDVGRLPNGGLVTLIVKHSNGNDVAFASDETNQAPQLSITSDGSDGPDPLLADKQANSLSLSPNPATNNITARFERPIKVKTIMVFDMIGRLVRTYKAEEVKNGDGYGLDLNFIQPGSYIIKTIDEQGNQFQKQMAIDY